nr:nucleoside-diphosphate sugar epimerase/dehydratase [Opitutus sp. ER46]
MILASVFLFALRMTGAISIPRGVLLIDFLVCTGGMCVGRLAARVFRERLTSKWEHQEKGRPLAPQQRIAIVGAGDAGAALAKEFVAYPSRGFRPVAFFDDDAAKHGTLIHGIPVVGRPERIAEMKLAHTVAKVVIAMPTAPAKRIREVVQAMSAQGLKVETLPSMADLAAGRVRASRIRPVEVQDLLGREQVDLDNEGIRASIQGRVVMVTGAGGSIGSELCRQIGAMAPKQLLLVEQCEGALFVIEQELNELGLGSIAVPLVGDIIDEDRMRYIFQHYQPSVVFHAAAHKHVYLMERQPAEAIHNNVLGTRMLAEIAAEVGVEKFVLISTDKAINPTSVMGATKRLAEIQLMDVHAAQRRENVYGARSVLTESAAASALRQADAVVAQAVGGNGNGHAGVGGHSVGTLQDARNFVGIAEPAGGNGTGHGAVGAGGNGGSTRQVAEHLVTIVAKHGERPAGVGGGVPPASVSSSRAPFGRTTPSARPTKFMAVRFGNVLGSSGSVIPIFKRQIANGGPVTVTHPEVTRYFMTIPEAVGLVLQTSILGQGGEIFVLDMGQPVKIVDLAKQMIELSGFKVGEDIEIKFSGLKPGEKLYEELQHKNEQHTPTTHPRIMRFTTNTVISATGIQELRQRLYNLDSNQLKQLLHRLVPEYRPHLD